MVVKELVTLFFIASPKDPYLCGTYFCAIYKTLLEAFCLEEIV